MTDNAKIVREALIECGKQLNCSMADDLLALTVLETELATAKADLARAREEKILDLEKIIALLTGDRLRVQIDSPIGWVTIASEGIIREEFRAALAPEQVPAHPETTQPQG